MVSCTGEPAVFEVQVSGSECDELAPAESGLDGGLDHQVVLVGDGVREARVLEQPTNRLSSPSVVRVFAHALGSSRDARNLADSAMSAQCPQWVPRRPPKGGER
jgi:hypothetical protein